jgi:hypothetical protein
VRAPGSNVTFAPRARAGPGASNNGSILTLPVNQSAGPLVEFCEPTLLISMFSYRPSAIHVAHAPFASAQISALVYDLFMGR